MRQQQEMKAPPPDDQALIFHPYNILMVLVIISLSVLFLSLTAAFTYNRIQSDLPPIKLPIIFLFNTMILLGSSLTIVWAKRAYLADNTREYQRALTVTILLSLVFLAAQISGWRQLFSQDILINTNNYASYLYVISGLHFFHVIAGLPFLVLFLYAAYKKMKDPVSVMVYFSDPEKRLKLKLLTIYWHFLDGLWIYLVLFFWINYLIR